MTKLHFNAIIVVLALAFIAPATVYAQIDYADNTSPAVGMISPLSATRTVPVTLSAPYSDAEGVTACSLYVDNTNIGEMMRLGDVSGSASREHTFMVDGSYRVYARCYDGAGNVGVGEAVTVSVTSSGLTGTTTTTSGGPPFTLTQMQADASVVVQANTGALLAHLGRACATDQSAQPALAARVDQVVGLDVDINIRTAILNFTICSTPTTIHLGGGERLGTVNSYKSAFGRWPSTSSHWFDVIKIANGRFPGETSSLAEAAAKTRFRTIYRREPNMTGNQNDKAAVTVMAYGLRPLPRNLNSEQAAILSYKAIFGRGPSSATDWDAVRAIAYSGARR